jgi:hypothetical protein
VTGRTPTWLFARPTAIEKRGGCVADKLGLDQRTSPMPLSRPGGEAREKTWPVNESFVGLLRMIDRDICAIFSAVKISLSTKRLCAQGRGAEELEVSAWHDGVSHWLSWL